MNWIDNIILGLIDMYETDSPYELCDLLGIEIIKVEPTNIMVKEDPSLYIRNYFGREVIFIRNDISNHYEEFYLNHELGHAVLHPDIQNSLNGNLINRDKLEKQANYFAFKLSNLHFDEIDLYEMSLEQIASCLEVPESALRQLVEKGGCTNGS